MYRIKIGENISRLRKTAGLTQEALAERMGVAQCTIGSWEYGRKMPRVERIYELSRIFGVPMSEILELDSTT